MVLLFMKQWLADSLMRSICWTLIHSLWQGLILAALAGLLLMTTRRSTAAIRYNLLAILFFVFMGVVTFTFFYQLNIPVGASTSAAAEGAIKNAGPAFQPLAVREEPTVQVYHEIPFAERFIAYFNQHASLLVAVWFIFFLAKSVKLMGGLLYLQRIRSHKVSSPAIIWKERLSMLIASVGITVPVRLLESGLVKVPLVTGWLKPIILIPIGVMANLPAEQVEAILLHELAHIRRRDFMVNLAQSFAEVLFFFNPAVLWLSSLLREEREHCCDDIAIGITRSKAGYIQALVSFQEYHLEKEHHYAMAFPGKKNQLLNRVRRILDNSNKSLNLAERSFLILCFSIMGILSVVIAQTNEQEKPQVNMHNKATEQPVVKMVGESDQSTDSSLYFKKKSDTVIYPDQSGETVNPYHLDSSMLYSSKAAFYSEKPPLYSDKTPLYKSKAPLYDDSQRSLYTSEYKAKTVPYGATYPRDTMPVLEKGGTVLTGVITHTLDGKVYKVSINNNKATGLTIDGEKVPEEKLSNYTGDIKRIFRSISDQHSEADEYRDKVKEDLRIREWKMAEADRVKADMQQKDEEKVRLGMEDKLKLENDIKIHNDLKLNNDVKLHNDKIKLQAPKLKDDFMPIIQELKRLNIITDEETLSFRIDKNGLVVNGQQQSKEISRNFTEKYIKNTSDLYTYDRKGNTTTTSIIRN